MPTSLTDVHVVNSTSYADVVGLELGLDRLAGEDTIAYLKRCTARRIVTATIPTREC
jgi:hypothetical protein